jgi:hypothetical protein
MGLGGSCVCCESVISVCTSATAAMRAKGKDLRPTCVSEDSYRPQKELHRRKARAMGLTARANILWCIHRQTCRRSRTWVSSTTLIGQGGLGFPAQLHAKLSTLRDLERKNFLRKPLQTDRLTPSSAKGEHRRTRLHRSARQSRRHCLPGERYRPEDITHTRAKGTRAR